MHSDSVSAIYHPALGRERMKVHALPPEYREFCAEFQNTINAINVKARNLRITSLSAKRFLRIAFLIRLGLESGPWPP